MSSTPIRQVAGQAVYISGDDIDTDRIIPARFMKCITFDGLGNYFFYDVRKDEAGKNREHNLNDPRFSDASILVTGNNFGCGSSREHAPQAILRAGFKVIIAGSFAEIFFGNATNLGIVCATASDGCREALAGAIEENPELEVTINVEDRKLCFGEECVECGIREDARESFLSGNYDLLGELLAGASEVTAVANGLLYMEA